MVFQKDCAPSVRPTNFRSNGVELWKALFLGVKRFFFLVDWPLMFSVIFSTEIVDQLLGLFELPEELFGKPCKPRSAWL
jgi:hypothetical protein